MKTVRVQSLLATALPCGLIFTCMNLFAQQGASSRRPVGPPLPASSQYLTLPTGSLPSALPAPAPSPLLTIKKGYDGTDFNGSNCGCLPPDTNAAVGGNFVVETVNFQLRVFDKATGTILLDETLATLFGAASGGDPYVVYDDNAGHWYISAFDTADTGLFLAVSNDANPLDGFKTYDLTAVGGFPDYNKLGYNKDAIFISFNNFGPGGTAGAEIASIDKAAILAGTLTYFVSTPAFQFRAMPPAQMHTDTIGGVEWFVSTDGTDAGGTTIRVTKMTNYLSSSPVFTYTSLPVTRYQNATTANQPGGTITTFPNTTFTQVHFRRGQLVAAMDSARLRDGFTFPKGLVYTISVSVVPPKLLSQLVIDPGAGVAVQMVSADQDKFRHKGITWMESSSTEYLSKWVGQSNLTKADVAPGGGFFSVNFRIGDYSSMVVDPSDGVTFVSANEYIGSDGAVDIWKTHIDDFTIP